MDRAHHAYKKVGREAGGASLTQQLPVACKPDRVAKYATSARQDRLFSAFYDRNTLFSPPPKYTIMIKLPNLDQHVCFLFCFVFFYLFFVFVFFVVCLFSSWWWSLYWNYSALTDPRPYFCVRKGCFINCRIIPENIGLRLYKYKFCLVWSTTKSN